MNFELRYQTEASDYLALLEHVLTRCFPGRWFSRCAWLLISILSWSSVILPYLKFGETGFGFWVRLGLAVTFTIGWPFFYARYCNACFSSIVNATTTRGLSGDTLLAADGNGLRHETKYTSTHSSWNDLYSIELTNKHLMIFFTPLVGAPIPRSVFGDKLPEFYANLQDCLRKGKASW